MMISVKNLSKLFKIPHERRDTLKEHFTSFFRKLNYEDFWALKNVEFEVKKGDFLGIIGKNGSGKSTLLKILAGIYTPSFGDVKVKGRISPFLELGVGFNADLSARDNVYLNGTILGLSREELDAKYEEIVAFAELGEFMDMKIKNFSSGMHVRLAFSIAIQADADVFLCDEVLAVGDMDFQKKCFDVFYKLKNSGKTIVFVSHDIQSVRRFCTKTILMEHGQMIAHGKTEDVIEKYIYGENESIEGSALHPEDIEDKSNFSTKKAEIEKLALLDKDGQPRNVFCPGDFLCLKVNFRVLDEKVTDINAGIAIYDEDGNHLFGDTGGWSDVLYSKERTEYQIKIKSLPLLSGRYFVTTAISSRDLQEQYDWAHKKVSFTIENSTVQVGKIKFPTEWS